MRYDRAMSELLDQSLERIPVNQSIIGQKVLESLRSRLATNFLSTLIAATLIFGVIWYHEKNQVYLAWYLLTIFIILSRLFENAFYKNILLLVMIARYGKTGLI